MAIDEELRILSGPEAATLLAELTNRVTIMARNAYRGRDEPDAEMLRAANETIHAISAKLIGVTRGSSRYEDASFLRSIRERARPGLSEGLEWAIADALKTVEASQKQR
jgi:hypothetical protein